MAKNASSEELLEKGLLFHLSVEKKIPFYDKRLYQMSYSFFMAGRNWWLYFVFYLALQVYLKVARHVKKHIVEINSFESFWYFLGLMTDSQVICFLRDFEVYFSFWNCIQKFFRPSSWVPHFTLKFNIIIEIWLLKSANEYFTYA